MCGGACSHYIRYLQGERPGVNSYHHSLIDDIYGTIWISNSLLLTDIQCSKTQLKHIHLPSSRFVVKPEGGQQCIFD